MQIPSTQDEAEKRGDELRVMRALLPRGATILVKYTHYDRNRNADLASYFAVDPQTGKVLQIDSVVCSFFGWAQTRFVGSPYGVPTRPSAERRIVRQIARELYDDENALDCQQI